MSKFDWHKNTWDIIDKPFESDPDFLVAHQKQSYDNFVADTIPRIIQHNMPITIKNENNSIELKVLRTYMSKPLTYEQEYVPLFPHRARINDLTYASPIFIDYEQTVKKGGETLVTIERKVPICELPVMLGSKFCHLYKLTSDQKAAVNECRYERGGYFIINGNEKVLVGQERPSDNTVMCHEESSSKPYVARAEIKSTVDQRFYPIKVAAVRLYKETDKDKKQKDKFPGQKFMVGLPYIREPIPLWIVFIALGVTTDVEIFNMLLNGDNNNNAVINLLVPTAKDARGIVTQIDAISYISKFVSFNDKKSDKQNTDTEDVRLEKLNKKKRQYAKDIINREFLPHVGQDNLKKAFFLAHMTKKLIACQFNRKLYADRDHYSNKRVDLAGPLLSQIFRYNFTNLVREIKMAFIHELTSQNKTVSVRKLIQKCPITSRLKYAMSTGNWHTTIAQATSASKKGIAQVLQRLSNPGTLSHLRRVQSPLERSGSKYEPPRRLHATQIGKCCPNETPEGAQVGVVKNMAFLCHISIQISDYPIRYAVSKLAVEDRNLVLPICSVDPKTMSEHIMLFINGDMVGTIASPSDASIIYKTLKRLKRSGQFGSYISIAWFQSIKEFVIQTDGGRYCHPVYTLTDNQYDVEDWDLDTVISKETNWHECITGSERDSHDEISPSARRGGFVEYLDTNEDETSLIAIFPFQLIPGKKHKVDPDTGLIHAQIGYAVNKKFRSQASHFLHLESDNVHAAVDLVSSRLSGEYKEIWDAQTDIKIVEVIQDKETIVLKATKPYAIALAQNLNRVIYNEYTLYTHAELHPHMWHGVTAQMIPFSDHNPSPRNCYQCLDKETPVLMANGEYIQIQHIKVGDKVVSVDPKTMMRKNTTVINQYVKPTDKKMVKLSTITGRDIVCTFDHPILALTNTSSKPEWIPSSELTEDHKIAVCPEVMSYDTINSETETILTAINTLEYLVNKDIKKSVVSLHIERLSKIGILPLSNNNKNLSILSRMVGYLMTDGSSGIYNGSPQIQLCFGSEKGCEQFQKDVRELGFKNNKASYVVSEIREGETHSVWQVIYNNEFASLMIALCVPTGKKTTQKSLPLQSWIKNGSKNVKREFLAGFQGGDGCKIRHNKLSGRKSGNYILNVTMKQKSYEHVDSLVSLMTELKEMFSEFGIITKKIHKAVNKNAIDRYNVGIVFECSRDNIINYYERIGYRYDHFKTEESLVVYEYLKYQQNLIKTIDNNKIDISKFIDDGLSNGEIGKILNMSASRVSSLYRAKDRKSRIPNKNKSFEEWLTMTTVIGNSIFVPVSYVEQHKRVEISDITVDDDVHSFITGSHICVHNSAMGKQAMGIYATNHNVRLDTMTNMLCYPQHPIVQTRTAKYTNLDHLPHGNMAIVAFCTYSGFNQEDSIIVNEAAIQRGFFSSIFSRTYVATQQRHKSGSVEQEKIAMPPAGVFNRRKGNGTGKNIYHAITKEGYPMVGAYVDGGDILISKYQAVKKNSTGEMMYPDSSITVKNTEHGIVDFVIPNPNMPDAKNSDGHRICKAKVSDLRMPEIGDKFATRHAQKGTIGMTYRSVDMPMTESGMVPDIIMNPHAIPSRMTIGQLIEALLGKVGTLDGEIQDATPFTDFDFDKIKERLALYGFDYNGDEVMYNGQTGEMFKVPIFINPTYYQRLKHMVKDKMHARDRGPVQQMTRQPAEGRAREGGLRIGEMERDCLIAYGASMYLKEKLTESSDIFSVWISRKTGTVVAVNPETGVYQRGGTNIYGGEEVVKVVIPYAANLFVNELRTAMIKAHIET
jgi:DNA-directed RNA polymerase beta subunit